MPFERLCGQCGQTNRIPPAHLADTGRCGACQSALPPPPVPLDIANSGDFDQIVQQARVPVLIDFWAEWCGPCRMAAPEVAKTAQAMVGKAVVVKVNTEQNPELARRFGVRGIPFFVVTKDGKTVREQAGLVKDNQLQQWIGNALNQ